MAANNIEIILQKITDEARSFEQKTLAEAEDNARAIREEYDEKAKEAKEKLIREATEKAALIVSGAESSGDSMSRNARLGMKVELIEKAFSLAKERLVNLPDDEYCSLFASVLSKVMIAGKKGTITVNERDSKKRLEKILSGAGCKELITPSRYTGDIAGGFILTYDDIHLCFSVEKLFSSLKIELETEAARLLFGDN